MGLRLPNAGGRPGRWRGISPKLVLLVVLVSGGAGYALPVHLALSAASPAADEALTVAPDAVRLSFTEPVELALSTIALTGPDGIAVALGPLESVEGRDVLLAPIEGTIVAGTYTVAWQAVGRDGHPVRGEYGFTIDEDAEGLAPPEPGPVVVEPRLPAEPPPAAPLPTFSAQSPLYAGVRWLTYLGIMGILGAVGFSLLLSSPRVERGPITATFRTVAARGGASIGILAAAVLGVSLPLRLQAQSHAVFGGGITADRFALLLQSQWGLAWLIQMIAMAVVLAGLLGARAGRTAGWVTAGIGAVALAVTPGMSGHAAAVESLNFLAVFADSLHMLGVGLWMGTLLVLLLVAVPLVRREVRGERSSILATLVRGFSPMALAAGALVVGTGVFASILHLTSIPDLWTTGYGRLLSAKLLLVAIVFGMGAYNWRTAGNRVGETGGDYRLRQSGAAEVIAAVVAIGLTAVLVAVPPPADVPDDSPAAVEMAREP